MKNNIPSIIVLLIITLFSSCIGGKSDKDLKLIPVQSGKYWGFIDHEGKYVINPQFKFAQPFSEGLALVQTPDDKFGYINMDGKYVINPSYMNATDFVDGHAVAVKENSKIEIINSKGETIVTLDESIEEAYKYSEGLARIYIGNKYGFIDTNGNIVIPATFAYADDFHEGLASVGDGIGGDRNTSIAGKKNSFGFINKKGELVINYQFESASNFSDGLAIISNGSKFGYIGTDGKIKINPQFDVVSNFSSGLAAFRQGNLWGYINKSGEIVINPQFKSVDLFYGNYLAPAVMADGKCGFIDTKGKYIINPQFDQATRFFGGIAFIYADKKFGIIDKTGSIIVAPQFDYVLTKSVDKLSEVNSKYFNINTIIDHLAKLITKNSVDNMNFETPVAEVVLKYKNAEENFNKYKNSLNRFDLTLIEKENISNYAFLVFELEVNNYDKNPTIDKFRFRIDLKSGWWSKNGEILSSLKSAFEGYRLEFEDSRSNSFILTNGIQEIRVETVGTDPKWINMIYIRVLRTNPYLN